MKFQWIKDWLKIPITSVFDQLLGGSMATRTPLLVLLLAAACSNQSRFEGSNAAPAAAAPADVPVVAAEPTPDPKPETPPEDKPAIQPVPIAGAYLTCQPVILDDTTGNEVDVLCALIQGDRSIDPPADVSWQLENGAGVVPFTVASRPGDGANTVVFIVPRSAVEGLVITPAVGTTPLEAVTVKTKVKAADPASQEHSEPTYLPDGSLVLPDDSGDDGKSSSQRTLRVTFESVSTHDGGACEKLPWNQGDFYFCLYVEVLGKRTDVYCETRDQAREEMGSDTVAVGHVRDVTIPKGARFTVSGNVFDRDDGIDGDDDAALTFTDYFDNTIALNRSFTGKHQSVGCYATIRYALQWQD